MKLHRRSLDIALFVALLTGVPQTVTASDVAPPAKEAADWIAHPATEERIDGFAPAADIRYRTYVSPKPLRVWIARIDLTQPGVRLTATEPADLPDEDGASRETRCANTLQFARQRGVQVAINASAFGPFRPRSGLGMDVVGMAAHRGQVYSEADPRFGAMFIGRDGRVALKAPPLPHDKVWTVLAGFRMVLDDGAFAVDPQVAASKFGDVNPRTAVGVDRAGETLWLVVIDGRQEGISAGATLVELAALFRSLGAWDALNLDGGGSSTFVVEEDTHTYRLMNTPVGRGAPNTLRQVATNLGVYLPGCPPRAVARESTMREEVIRQAASRRGGGYKWAGGGVSKDLTYEGQTILKANPEGTFCCGATLEVFLDAYSRRQHGFGYEKTQGRWFEDWPLEKLQALRQGWWGMEEALSNPLLPEAARPTIREKQVYHALPWAGFATAGDDYRQLQRGDFVQFWRKSGSGHSVIYWGRDWDEQGKERLWYWSSQGKPRYAYPRGCGEPPERLPGFGVNWEYVGEEIDPARIYGAALIDPASP